MRKLAILIVLLASLLFSTSASATTTPFVDQGGPILTNGILGHHYLYVLWWGNTFDPNEQAQATNFYQQWNTSSELQLANEYARGGYFFNEQVAQVAYDTTSRPSKTITTNAVRNEAVKVFGYLDPQGIYVVLGDQTATTINGIPDCGMDLSATVNEGGSPRIPFTYTPAGCGGGMTAARYAAEGSHELLETLTDPDQLHPAWVNDPANPDSSEVADPCAWQTSYFPQTMPDGSQWFLSGIWSNVADACIWAT